MSGWSKWLVYGGGGHVDGGKQVEIDLGGF